MLVANAITSVRLVAAPLTACAVVGGFRAGAAALFALAVITDLGDGIVARSRGEASTFGGVFDHATDATYVTLVLAALAWLGEVPHVLPPLVALAFLQYLIDSRAHTGARLRASQLGRWNGIAYYVLAGTPIVRDALALTWPPGAWVRGLGWLLVVTTGLSMFDRWSSRRRALGSPEAGTKDR
jgi:phosphatidylglycerophosphate synthase